jgi:hypothetical protein
MWLRGGARGKITELAGIGKAEKRRFSFDDRQTWGKMAANATFWEQ